MKVLKRVVIVLLALVALLVAGIAIFMAVFDPNDYKEDIRALVKEETGRDLTIEGDIGWSVYPSIGVDVGPTKFANAEGFSDQPQIETNNLSVYVKLLPLLSGTVEAEGVALDGLTLRVTTDKNGRTNYDDILEKMASKEKEPEAESPDNNEKSDSQLNVSVGSVAITNATVIIDNQQTGEKQTIEQFSLLMPDGLEFNTKTQALSIPEWEISAFDSATLRGELTSEPIGVSNEASDNASDNTSASNWMTAFQGEIVLEELAPNQLMSKITGQPLSDDLPSKASFTMAFTGKLGQNADSAEGNQVIALNTQKFTAEITMNGEDLSLNADEIKLDTKATIADVTNLVVTGLGLNAAVNINAANIIDAPQYSGSINLQEFSARELAKKLGVELPAMRDDQALEQVALAAQINGDANALALTKMKMQLDGSNISGRLAIKDFKALALAGELEIDQINLDRYLSDKPAAEATGSDAGSSGAEDVNAIQIPAGELQGINAELGLNIGALQVANLKMNQVKTNLKAKNGLIDLNPMQFNLYNGRFRGSAKLDARPGQTSSIAIKSDMKSVASQPLQMDLLQKAYASGLADLFINVTATGQTVGDIRQTLAGTISTSFSNGQILGLNLSKYLRQFRALKKGNFSADSITAAGASANESTDFSAITASCQINQGVANCDNLKGEMPGLRLGGLGQINLFAETLDYTLNVSVVETSQGQGGEDLSELKGITLPVRCQGTWAEPSCKPELANVLRDMAKDKVKEEIEDRLKEKYGEDFENKLEEKLDDKLKDKLGEEGADLLKGLF